MSYPEIWFRGMKPDDKDRLLNSLKNSELSEKIQEILKTFERELTMNKADYDSPSWSHKQAHYNGMREAYNRIQKLFDHKENK